MSRPGVESEAGSRVPVVSLMGRRPPAGPALRCRESCHNQPTRPALTELDAGTIAPSRAPYGRLHLDAFAADRGVDELDDGRPEAVRSVQPGEMAGSGGDLELRDTFW